MGELEPIPQQPSRPLDQLQAVVDGTELAMLDSLEAQVSMPYQGDLCGTNWILVGGEESRKPLQTPPLRGVLTVVGLSSPQLEFTVSKFYAVEDGQPHPLKTVGMPQYPTAGVCWPLSGAPERIRSFGGTVDFEAQHITIRGATGDSAVYEETFDMSCLPPADYIPVADEYVAYRLGVGVIITASRKLLGPLGVPPTPPQ